VQHLLAPAETDVVSPARRRGPSWGEIGLLVGIGVVGLALRWPDLDAWYWGDEIQTVVISDGSLADIPGRLEKDGAPPLFYFLLNLWTRVFGTSATATHALTTTLSLVTVAVAWWFGRRHSGRLAGLLAAAAIAVNPYLVLYSTETRNYALFALLGVVAAGFMLDVLAVTTRWAHFALGVTLGLAMLTHAWGLFFAAATLGVLVLVAFARRDRELGVRALIAGAVAGLVFLPWLPTFVGQLRHTGAPWNTRYSIFSTLDQLVAYLGDRPVAAVVVLAVRVGAGAAVLAHKLPIDPLLVAAACALTLAMAFVLSYIEPIWQARYGVVVLGALLLVVAMIAAITRVGTVALVVAIVAMLLFTARDIVDRPVDAKPDATLRHVAAQLAGDPPTFVLSDQGTLNGLRYQFGDTVGERVTYVSPLGVLDDPTLYDWRDDLDHLRAADPTAVAVSVVGSAAPGDTFVLIRRTVVVPRGESDTEWQSRYVETTDELLAAVAEDDRLTVVDEAETAGWTVVTLRRR
jgi:hypothetical protein